MDQRYQTFLFGPYDQVPGASCSILYILVLFLVLFNAISNLSFTCLIMYLRMIIIISTHN